MTEQYKLDVSGLAAGEYKIKANRSIVAATEKDYPMNGSVGYATTDSLIVTAAPKYALSVKQEGDSGRVVSAETGAQLTFKGTYQTDRQAELSCTTQIKKDGKYLALEPGWTVSSLPSTVTVNGEANITITVPANTQAGIYRLLFTMGDREIPYNIIVK